MVRLADLPEAESKGHIDRIATLPAFGTPNLAKGPSLADRRIALLTTAGLHLRSDQPFDSGGAGIDYRVIPGDVKAADLVMSHASVNFDRTGFQSDWNVVFALDRLKELVRDKVVGSIAAFHYSFMGAIPQVTHYEPKARELAAMLRQDRVDGVLLSPV